MKGSYRNVRKFFSSLNRSIKVTIMKGTFMTWSGAKSLSKLELEDSSYIVTNHFSIWDYVENTGNV